MTKKPEISEEEANLFRNAMRGVKLLPKTNIIAPELHRPKLSKKYSTPDENPLSPYSDFEREPLVTGDDLLEYNQQGIQYKNLRKLRLGQYNVEAILDLHGMRADEAREALYRFLQKCQQKGIRHILIIHGKGRTNNVPPVLKNKLNNWLRQVNEVLAFCSAIGRDGHSGAMYVLLKQIKREKKI